MKNNKPIIRTARICDAAELLHIYAPYVLKTAVSFEYSVPSVEEFAGRIENTLKKYPYFVAVIDEKIVGYIYAGAFKQRQAYDFCVEISVYVGEDYRHQGIGAALYKKMEAALLDMGIVNVYACIAIPEGEDEYLDLNSVMFHTKIGYKEVARFDSCGYKFDRWYGIVWMEKELGRHESPARKIKAFNQINS